MPTKAIYETFESSPEVEFDFWLCERLGWRSVERMRREMTAAEYVAWSIYFQRRAQRIELAKLMQG